MASAVWASLDTIRGKDCLQYRIRFSARASVLLKNVDYVYVRRTESGSHIILSPMSCFSADKGMPRDVYHVGWWNGVPVVYCTPLVSGGFFRRDLFDGEHRKLKRDSKGRVYICMNEIIEKEDKKKG